MTDDLVKRLEEEAECYRGTTQACLLEAKERIEQLEAALRVAAGYISTKEGHTDQHPQDVYDWIVSAALAGEKKDASST